VHCARLRAERNDPQGDLLFRIRVARTLPEIERFGSVWDSLLAPELTLFQSYRWNLLAARIFSSREAPHFIHCEDDNGVAIVPAVVDSVHGRVALAGEALFDYRDYLAWGDEAPLIRAWERLASLGLPLEITAVRRANAAVWDRLPKAHFSRSPQLVSATLTSDGFLHSHSRAFSRLRKLERMGLRLEQHTGDSKIAEVVYRARAAQSSEGELFHDPLRAQFMVEICRQERAQCEIFTLCHGGTMAAALVTFCDRRFRRFYTTYYDHNWARYSPGVCLLFEVVRRSLDQGLDFDFMTGEQSYKLRIAQSAEDLYRVQATAEEFLAALSTRAAA
jgi:hypothetical protein